MFRCYSAVLSDGDDDGHGHNNGDDLFDKFDTGPHDNSISSTEFRHLFMDFDAWPRK